MHLSDHDLKQLNEDGLRILPVEPLRDLSIKLLADLKEARDRLNRTPKNSSKPPSAQAPWEKPDLTTQEQTPSPAANTLNQIDTAAKNQPQQEEAQEVNKSDNPVKRDAPPKRPGRQPGAPGHSRTQQIPITAERIHIPEHCAICGQRLNAANEQHAYTARCEVDVMPPSDGTRGLVVSNTKHTYMEVRCACGHWTRAQPARAAKEDKWTVELTEWHLAGPMLVALICSLSMRMRLSRARIQELLHDWLWLDLSTATINQCIHEAGRAVEPVVENEILQCVREAEVLNADETSWFEGKQMLWLWVFTCASATLFVIGRRTRELVVKILGENFENWLMSDGYSAYRDFNQRLRCLAHIIRKARGLAESLDERAQGLGNMVLDLMDSIFKSVYQARAAPPEVPLRQQYAPRLRELFDACVRNAESEHEKTRAFARELLNDWDTFWVVLDHPHFPLTNNEAERALRHWVIARSISHGTRTGQGTNAFANLASVIETCRKRSTSPWAYIAEVVRLRRMGLAVPLLPSAMK